MRWSIRSKSLAAVALLSVLIVGCGDSTQRSSSEYDAAPSNTGLRETIPQETDTQMAPVSQEFDFENASSTLQSSIEKSPSRRGSIKATRPPQNVGGESYSEIVESRPVHVSENPRSTFSIDVDTASYANVRRFLESGQLPPADAIRLEELINYFTYDDPTPNDGRPFSVTTKVANCPWDTRKKLVRIGLRGQEVESSERQPANLVFLIDVSGSMRTENKLPLVKRSLHRLLEELNQRDHISIVTYASGVQTKLQPTPAHQQHRISQAIDSLNAGGSTNGSAGLKLAYEVAQQKFTKFGTNRVILCSDGDFNVGVTDERQLVNLIADSAKTGVFLSVLGFGTGNYHDSLAEKLADHGNGNYAYIDSYSEARKVLVEQMTGTLETIAKDVKIQVEFNPANVAAYRLIGYENRALATRDFRDDKKDAGELGAGHSVTALYEVIQPSSELEQATGVPELRYQKVDATVDNDFSGELLTVRVRYKLPTEDVGKEFVQAVNNADNRFGEAGADFRFAAAVAAFGMILRDSQYAEDITWGDVRQWAESSIGSDPRGYRTEFLNLLTLAERLVDRPKQASREWQISYSESDDEPQAVKIDHETKALLSGTMVDMQTLVTFAVVICIASMISLMQK